MLSNHTTQATDDQINHFTVFLEGTFCTQTIVTKYMQVGAYTSSTGQIINCTGFNNLKPLDVISNPIIDEECKEINTNAVSPFNPLNISSMFFMRFSHWYHGIEISQQTNQLQGDLNKCALTLSEISVGQENDIASVKKRYEAGVKANPGKKVVFYGISKGAAGVFEALKKYRYPASLVVLEGCFYSLEDIFPKMLAKPLAKGLSLFTKYQTTGPAPFENLDTLPSDVPIAFITSKKDRVVPAASTIKLAETVASAGRNPVYLLVLEHSSHPNYMFDHQEDHDQYEQFINALKKRYDLKPYNVELANLGEPLLGSCLLSEKTNPTSKRSCKAF